RTLAFLLASLGAAACGGERAGEAPDREQAPVDGGTAVISRISDFDAFNQLVSTDYDTSQVLRNMLYMPLVRLDENMEYEAYMADSMHVAEDGMSATFRVREGLTWHDGTPVTADDVVWSIETYMNPDLAFANLQYFQFVDRVERLDDRTVVVHFTEPHSDALADFTEWEPHPKHLLEDVPIAEMRTAAFNRNPVGNGPFKFVSWTANQQVVFEANPDFVMGRPHLDRVVFRIIPEQTTELTELLTGNLDMIRAVQPAEAARVEQSDAARLLPYEARSYTYRAWNTANPLFSDARVRRALTMGMDRQQIVDALLYGYGEVGITDVMPFQWEFNEELEPWPYDPEGAKALLAEAGWTDSDGDGTLDKDGRPFRFILETNQGNDLREDLIVIAQSDLAKIGVAVEPRLTEWNTLIDRLKRKDFVAVVSGWSVDFKFDPTETLSCEGGVYNYPAYCNPQADALVRRALTTLTREEARPAWDEYQEIIHQDQPYTFLYYLNERLGVSRRLQGVEADARGHLVTIADWWIPAGQQGRSAPVAMNR
ncbi:MAG TPA: peptide-binding protein, partial [Gemmatimonadota bacterium]|nr:peptide-binding protein [Gemmatimonadota bacterium]